MKALFMISAAEMELVDCDLGPRDSPVIRGGRTYIVVGGVSEHRDDDKPILLIYATLRAPKVLDAPEPTAGDGEGGGDG